MNAPIFIDLFLEVENVLYSLEIDVIQSLAIVHLTLFREKIINLTQNWADL